MRKKKKKGGIKYTLNTGGELVQVGERKLDFKAWLAEANDVQVSLSSLQGIAQIITRLMSMAGQSSTKAAVVSLNDTLRNYINKKSAQALDNKVGVSLGSLKYIQQQIDQIFQQARQENNQYYLAVVSDAKKTIDDYVQKKSSEGMKNFAFGHPR